MYNPHIFLMSYQFRTEQWVAAPIERVFRFFANPGNLPRLMSPWMQVELLRVKIVAPPGIEADQATITDIAPFAGAGSELVASYRALPVLPFRITSTARITQFAMNRYFEDVQKQGPFRSWNHRHEFMTEERNGVNGTVIRDIVEYDIGFGWLGVLAQKLFVGPQMRRTFVHRQKMLAKLLT